MLARQFGSLIKRQRAEKAVSQHALARAAEGLANRAVSLGERERVSRADGHPRTALSRLWKSSPGVVDRAGPDEARLRARLEQRNTVEQRRSRHYRLAIDLAGDSARRRGHDCQGPGAGRAVATPPKLQPVLHRAVVGVARPAATRARQGDDVARRVAGRPVPEFALVLGVDLSGLRELFERAAKATGHTEFVVIGSLSILGVVDRGQVPPRMLMSIDVDCYTRHDPDRIFELKDGAGRGQRVRGRPRLLSRSGSTECQRRCRKTGSTGHCACRWAIVSSRSFSTPMTRRSRSTRDASRGTASGSGPAWRRGCYRRRSSKAGFGETTFLDAFRARTCEGRHFARTSASSGDAPSISRTSSGCRPVTPESRLHRGDAARSFGSGALACFLGGVAREDGSPARPTRASAGRLVAGGTHHEPVHALQRPFPRSSNGPSSRFPRHDLAFLVDGEPHQHAAFDPRFERVERIAERPRAGAGQPDTRRPPSRYSAMTRRSMSTPSCTMLRVSVNATPSLTIGVPNMAEGGSTETGGTSRRGATLAAAGRDGTARTGTSWRADRTLGLVDAGGGVSFGGSAAQHGVERGARAGAVRNARRGHEQRGEAGQRERVQDEQGGEHAPPAAMARRRQGGAAATAKVSERFGIDATFSQAEGTTAGRNVRPSASRRAPRRVPAQREIIGRAGATTSDGRRQCSGSPGG